MSNNLQIKIDLFGKDQLSQKLNKIQKATKQANDAFKEMQSKVKSLEQLQGKISSFKTLRDGLKKQSESIKKVNQLLNKNSERFDDLDKIKKERLARLKVARNAMRHLDKNSQSYIQERNTAIDNIIKAQIKYDSVIQKMHKNKQTAKDLEVRLKNLNITRGNSIEQIKKVTQTLKENGISVNNLSAHEESLAIKIKGGTSQLNREAQALERLNKKLILNNRYKARQAELTEKAQKAQQFGMKSFGAGAGVLYGTKHFLNPAIDFEKQMSAVQAKLNLDKNSPIYQAVRKKAMELGASTSFTAGQVAEMMDKLAMAGFTGKDILGGIEGTLNLTKASGSADPAQIADVASNIAGVFKIKASDTKAYNHLLDLLTHTVVTSNVDVSMLGDTMKYLAQATELNLKPQQALAMAGMLGNVGLQGTQGGTILRSMLNRLAGPNSATKKAFKKLHIKFTKSGDQAKDFVKFLTELDGKLKGMGNAKRDAYIKQIFGVEAVSGMVELIHQAGQGALQQYIKTYDKVDGFTAKVARRMANNTAGDIDNMTSAWEGLSITIFNIVEPALRWIISKITALIRVINNFAKSHKILTASVLGVVIVLGTLASAIGAAALIYSFFLSPIWKVITATKAFISLIRIGTGVMTAFNVITALNPIVLWGAAIIAVIGFVVLLYNKWKWFHDKVNAIFIAIKNNILNFIESVKNIFSNPFDFKAWDTLLLHINPVTNALSLLGDTWTKIKDFLGFGDNEKTVKLKQITENETIQKAGALQTRTAIASALNAPQVTIDRKAPIKAKGNMQTINAPMTATININGSHLTHEQLQHAVHQAMQQAHNEHQAKLRASLVDQY